MVGARGSHVEGRAKKVGDGLTADIEAHECTAKRFRAKACDIRSSNVQTTDYFPRHQLANRNKTQRHRRRR